MSHCHAGDADFYPPDAVSFKKVTPNEHSRLWGEIGLNYPLNEYRAMWKMGGEPLVQRALAQLDAARAELIGGTTRVTALEQGRQP